MISTERKRNKSSTNSDRGSVSDIPKAAPGPVEPEPSPRKAPKPAATASFPGMPASTPAKPASVANFANIARQPNVKNERNASSPGMGVWGSTGNSTGYPSGPNSTSDQIEPIMTKIRDLDLSNQTMSDLSRTAQNQPIEIEKQINSGSPQQQNSQTPLNSNMIEPPLLNHINTDGSRIPVSDPQEINLPLDLFQNKDRSNINMDHQNMDHQNGLLDSFKVRIKKSPMEFFF